MPSPIPDRDTRCSGKYPFRSKIGKANLDIGSSELLQTIQRFTSSSSDMLVDSMKSTRCVFRRPTCNITCNGGKICRTMKCLPHILLQHRTDLALFRRSPLKGHVIPTSSSYIAREVTPQTTSHRSGSGSDTYIIISPNLLRSNPDIRFDGWVRHRMNVGQGILRSIVQFTLSGRECGCRYPMRMSRI